MSNIIASVPDWARGEISRLKAIVEEAKHAERYIALLEKLIVDLASISAGDVRSVLATEKKPEPKVPPSAPLAIIETLRNIPQNGAAVLAPKPETASDPDLAPPAGVEEYADAATLDPLTSQRYADVFDALWACKNDGVLGTSKSVAVRAGYTNAADALNKLCAAGYAVRDSVTTPFTYRPIAKGKPRIIPWDQNVQFKHAAVKVMAGAPGSALPATQETSEIHGDPQPGRSAFDRQQALASLDIVAYLSGHGHDIRKVTNTLYEVDGKHLHLPQVLTKVNGYRAKARLEPIDVGAFE